jgi:hypothetical protein
MAHDNGPSCVCVLVQRINTHIRISTEVMTVDLKFLYYMTSTIWVLTFLVMLLVIFNNI